MTRGWLVLVLLAPAVQAQARVERVVVEQRITLAESLTPEGARRKAREEAMAEAVRQVAGVRVQSTVMHGVRETRDSLRSDYRSVVQLDAAGRAVDLAVVAEQWETSAGGLPVYRATFAVTVALEEGATDPGFTLTATLPAAEYIARAPDPRRNDELVTTVRSSRAAQLFLFSLADDSVTLLLPNAYTGPIALAAEVVAEVPDAGWRDRGLRVRVTPPRSGDRSDDALVAVAVTAGTTPPVPPATGSLLDLQRWLVAIPVPARAIAFAPYVVRARSP